MAGLDSKGHGCVFTFDAVGSFERVAATAVGGGQALALPILDAILERARADAFKGGSWAPGEEDPKHFQVWREEDSQGTKAERPGRGADLGLLLPDAVSLFMFISSYLCSVAITGTVPFFL